MFRLSYWYMHEMPHPFIRAATVMDAPTIASIHVASWKAAYSELLPVDYLESLSVPERTASWRRLLESGDLSVSVAVTSGELVGFISYGQSRDADKGPGYAEIQAIYLLPAFHRNGIGTALTQCACDYLRVEGYGHVLVWVLKDNAQARSFYESMGFLDDGQVKLRKIGEKEVSTMRYRRSI